jgi:hypothetical protein
MNGKSEFKQLLDNLSDSQVLTLIRAHLTSTERKDIVERYMEISKFERQFIDCGYIEKTDSEGTISIDCIDPYVDFKMHTAFRCYKIGAFNATMVFLGAAVEEELARLYEMKNDKFNPVEWTGQKLLDWASKKDISIVKESERLGLSSLIYARNYHAHANRLLGEKTKDKLSKGALDGVLPIDVEIPKFMEELIQYWENATGKKMDTTQPKLGWLGTKECVLKAIELVVSFIIRTSREYPSESVLEMMKTSP